jgi:hypothetical protein
MTRGGFRGKTTIAAAAALFVASAATAAADVTYASTVASGFATTTTPNPLRADAVLGAATARLAAETGPDGAIVDGLSIDFDRPSRGDAGPCVVWTGFGSARIDLADVAWTGEKSADRRVAAPSDADRAPLAAYVADMAWTTGVAEQTSGLAGVADVPKADFLVDAVSSPEPGAAALFALGAAGLAAAAWTRRRRGA